jgi:hypothetical protein
VLSVKRILRDYEDAGSVNSLISLWGFVDDVGVPDEGGHVGIAYRLRGIDYEGLTHAQAPPSFTAWRQRSDCLTSTGTSINTSSNAPFRRSAQPHARSPSRTRLSKSASRT